MYVLRAGRLEIMDEAAGAVIREHRRGDALGELALLTGSPPSVRPTSPDCSTARRHCRRRLTDRSVAAAWARGGCGDAIQPWSEPDRHRRHRPGPAHIGSVRRQGARPGRPARSAVQHGPVRVAAPCPGAPNLSLLTPD